MLRVEFMLTYQNSQQIIRLAQNEKQLHLTAEVEGSQIAWVKDTSTEVITLTITSPDGSTTIMSVPVGDFKF